MLWVVFKLLTMPHIVFMLQSTNFYNATCVFWNITDRLACWLNSHISCSNISSLAWLLCSQWSTEGVELVAENESHYTCQSTHLTSFAVLVSINPLPVHMETFTLYLLIVSLYAGYNSSWGCGSECGHVHRLQHIHPLLATDTLLDGVTQVSFLISCFITKVSI